VTLLDLLDDCARLGVELDVAGEELRISAPVGVMTAELRQQLRRHKAELLGHLRSGAPTARGRVEVAPADADRGRLSAAQRSLWFLHALDRASLTAYAIRQAIRIEGDLDPPRWRQALETVVGRHESLRTTFAPVDERPVARLHQAVLVPFREIDLRDLPLSQREGALARLMDEDGRQPFDLSAAPLVRASLVRLDACDWRFLISAHHLVADAWSAGVVLREMLACYNGAPLAPPPLQFADAVHWEERHAADPEHERDLAWWRARLADPPVLRLPTEPAASAAADYRGGSTAIALPHELARALADLARREGVTMFSLMLAVYNVLLHRYSAATDLCVGTSVAGRPQRELEDVVGFFANLIVLRFEDGWDGGFRDLLARVHREVLEGFAHQQVPFDAVVKAVRPDRALGQNPLFRAHFLYLRSEIEQLSSPVLRLSTETVPSVASKFDLSLHVEQTAAGCRLLIEYKTSLFRAETIEQMMQALLALLQAVVRDPDAPVAALPIMTPAARSELLMGRNAIRPARPEHVTLHGWFTRVAQLHADRIAVTDGVVQLSYGALERRSNRLALALLARGVRCEDRVGLYVDRSCDMIVAILAILKAGGAYVPLDPTDAPARRATMLARSGVVAVVTTRRMAAELEPDGAARVCIDQLEDVAGDDAAPPAVDVVAANAAYVIHTSGSTGTPRGVVVTHGNVTRLMAATEEWFDFDQNDVWTLFHSVAFDFSVWEMWGALLYGGRLVVVPYLVSRAPERFLDLLAQENVTVLNQTPSAFRALIAGARHAEMAAALRLRTVIFGGEALEPSMLLPWVDAHGDQRPELINMYGITETTVHVTRRRITRALARESVQSLIGERIGDLTLTILDARFEPVPDGVAGEMHIGGAGVARGYLGLPGGTAERFVPDPHAQMPGARMYRSGDVACWRPDADIAYFGRGDHQIKVRGFRIEPGEIEAVLAREPRVRDCVVVARGEGTARRQLVAYYRSRAEGAIAAAALRELCERNLPPHMVPAAFVQLGAWPLTRNGKLDRDALPAPGDEARAASGGVEPPRGAAERAIARAWQTVLASKAVGRHDDFFALGGDSILSLEVLALLRAAGFEASVAMLYQHPRLADLARALEPAGGDCADRTEAAAALAPFALLRPIDRDRVPHRLVDAYPLSQLQAGMLFEEQLSPEDALYRDVFSFHVRLPLDIDAWQAEIAGLLARHDVLRTSVSLADFSEPLQLVHETAVLRCAYEDASALPAGAQEQKVLGIVEEMRRTPYELATPPLLRFHLVRRAPDRMQIVLGFHHVILDGWSVATLMTQLLSGYAARCRGSLPPLRQPPPVRFAEAIAAERAALVTAAHERFWKEEIARLPAGRLTRSPPTDRARKRDIRLVPVPLVPAVTDGLRQLAARAGVPLKTVALAAHLRVLSFLTGDREVVTGLVGNNRPEREGGERVLGLFLGTLPLRLTFADDQGSHIDLVRATFAAERRLLDHRGYPLAAIKALAGGRNLFDSAFNFVHFHVYEAITRDGGVDVLAHQVWEQTDFPFVAQASVLPTSDAFELTLIADTGMFGMSRLERIAACYARCLEAMATRMDEPWRRAALMSATEREGLLVRGRPGTYVLNGETTAPQTLHERFLAAAQRHPDAIALTAPAESVSYAELAARSARLARHLRAQGIAGETRVGLCLGRSVDQVVAILAVLQAGGAYVPLDPAHPRSRLADAIEDSAIALVLTRTEHAELLRPARCVLMDDDAAWRELSAAPLGTPADPANAAYVIYTSGSSGRPKGVVVQHGHAVRLFDSTADTFRINATDVWTLFHSYAFDFSVWEMWGALLHGGRLVIVPHETSRAPGEFLDLLDRERVTILNQTPSAFAQLAAEDARRASDGSSPKLALRQVIFGGEALDPASLRDWITRRGDAAPVLTNMYGITETTVHVTHRRMRVHDAFQRQGSTIGVPIDDLGAYVLDAAGELVPVGTPGELYVSGAGVARGYLRRGGLTATRFVPDPFGDGRLYRSGDAARWTEEGELEFLGRLDAQVKVRGFRIELGEIEHVLRGAGLRDVAVLQQPETMRLVAYGVRAAGSSADARSLRVACEAQLPDYMIPGAFVLLDALPLTVNGKLDVAALPAPDADALAGASYVAPRNAIEERLCAIWQQVLEVERVGVEDKFFDLGGHSLHATQLASRINQAFGVRLPLRALFETPTVARLAERIREADAQPILRPEARAAGPTQRPRPRPRQRVALGGDGAVVGDP
jgi:amino acid adenylation domain-containing protein